MRKKPKPKKEKQFPDVRIISKEKTEKSQKIETSCNLITSYMQLYSFI